MQIEIDYLNIHISTLMCYYLFDYFNPLCTGRSPSNKKHNFLPNQTKTAALIAITIHILTDSWPFFRATKDRKVQHFFTRMKENGLYFLWTFTRWGG